VQTVGSAGNIPGANAYEIAIKLGSTFDVPVEHMSTPVIVESKQIRDALMRDATIRHTMDFAPKCNIGLVGIGEVSDSSTMIQTGYLKSQDLEFVAANEGVGGILGHYYDVNGQEIHTPWQDRIMGMSLKQLCQIDNVIGVAAGKEKSLAVWGALHGGYINTLIVNMSLAETISARLDQEESSFVG
jgi:DNA-binding transcriptional regulator LsrR (DeoR family)